MDSRRGGAVGVILFVVGAKLAWAGGPDSHREAALELYRLLGGDKLVQQAADAALVSVRSNPQLAPYEDVVKEWITKVLAASDLETEMSGAYAEAFSDEELRQLIAFYHTSVGQKALAQMPALMRRGAEIGSRLAKENSHELEDMIAKRKKELEQKEQKDQKEQ